MFKLFVKSLWISMPTNSLQDTSVMGNGTDYPDLTQENVKKFVKNPQFKTSRKYSWEVIFGWYFPTTADGLPTSQGWKNLQYLTEYFRWYSLATEYQKERLKSMFMEMDVLPGGTEKDKLWIQRNKKDGQGTGLLFTIK